MNLNGFKRKLEKKGSTLEMPIDRKKLSKTITGDKSSSVLFTEKLKKVPPTPFQKEFDRINESSTLEYNKGLMKPKRDREIIKQEIKSKENIYNQTLESDDAKRSKLKMELLQLTDELNSSDANDHNEFIDDFNRWLVGKGKEEDHALTPWSRQPLTNVHPSITEYIKGFVSKRHDFLAEIIKLKTFIFTDLNLDNAYLYFKYIVRGRMDDPSTLGFLAEWDSFLSRITREEKEKYGINDEQAESLNIFNNSFGNPPTDAKENILKKNHIPSLMDEFSSLLKVRALQSQSSLNQNANMGDKEEDYDLKNDIITDQRIRRNNLYLQLKNYRYERKDIGQLLNDYEKKEELYNTDYVHALIKKKAEFEKRSEVINKRLNWIKGSNLNLGENGYREVENELVRIDNVSEHLNKEISEIINKEGWGDQNDRKQLFKFYKSNLNSSKNSDGSSKPLITPLTSQNVTKILNRYVLNGEESLDDGERNYITDALLKNKDEQSNPFRKLITENYNDKSKEAIQRIIIKGNSDRLKDIELMEKEFKLQDLINISNNLSNKQYNEIQTIRSEKLRLKLKDWLSFDKQTDIMNIGENIKEIHSLEEILWSDKDGETNEQMKNRQINERSLIDAKSIMDSIVDDDPNVSNLLQQAEAINRVEHLKNDLKRKEHTIPMATRKKLSLHLIKVKKKMNEFVVDGKELFITKELKSLDEDLRNLKTKFNLESLGESIETFKKHSEQIKENFKEFIKEKKDQVSSEINRYNETLKNISNGISETSMPIDYDKQYEENFNSIDKENLL
ncbi:hypothetical protein ACTFIY_011122 [Dictyostelium cf. discoideum]